MDIVSFLSGIIVGLVGLIFLACIFPDNGE